MLRCHCGASCTLADARNHRLTSSDAVSPWAIAYVRKAWLALYFSCVRGCDQAQGAVVPQFPP